MKPKKQSVSSVNSKRELKALQRTFAEIIRRPLTPDDRMRPHVRSGEMIEPSRKLAPHERLELYAQQYWWRIEQSFDDDFPCVQRVLSQKKYLALRDSYLDKCKSESYTLRNLGKRFPDFIKKHPRLTAPDTALVYDCARFDWACIETFDSGSEPPLGKRDLASPRFVRERLRLQPHIRLLKLEFPIDQLLKQGRLRSSEAASNTRLKNRKAPGVTRRKVKKTPVYLALHRHEERTRMKRLSPDAFGIYEEFSRGASLASLMKRPSMRRITERELHEIFQELTSLGWIYKQGKKGEVKKWSTKR